MKPSEDWIAAAVAQLRELGYGITPPGMAGGSPYQFVTFDNQTVGESRALAMVVELRKRVESLERDHVRLANNISDAAMHLFDKSCTDED